MRKYSSQDRIEWLALYAEGLSSSEVERRTGISKYTGLSWAREEGITRSKKEALRLKYGTPTKEQQRAVDLYDSGLSIDQVADITDTPRSTITSWVYRFTSVRSRSEAMENRYHNPRNPVARRRRRKIRETVRLKLEGLLLDDIGQRLGISGAAVSARLHTDYAQAILHGEAAH